MTLLHCCLHPVTSFLHSDARVERASQRERALWIVGFVKGPVGRIKISQTSPFFTYTLFSGGQGRHSTYKKDKGKSRLGGLAEKWFTDTAICNDDLFYVHNKLKRFDGMLQGVCIGRGYQDRRADGSSTRGRGISSQGRCVRCHSGRCAVRLDARREHCQT